MQKSLKTRLISSIISLAVVTALLTSLLVFWFSTAKYTSQINGRVEYEPALFNTVLMGNLEFTHKVTEGEVVKEYVETNGKLTTSIKIDANNEFGAIVSGDAAAAGSLTSDERRLRPGSMVAIPFTVTNGTTLPSDGEKGNLAQTDILFSIDLITTVNIPLQYEVYEYTTAGQLEYMRNKSADDTYNYLNYFAEEKKVENWGTKLGIEPGDVESSELIGKSRTYKIRPTTYNKDAGTEETNKFSLVRDESGTSLSVKRYMLVICWPDEDEADRSTEYMKEIDILEVRLEVESWVKNTVENSPTYKEGSTGYVSINAAAIGDETYYFLPSAADNPTGLNVSNIYGRYTVPFYATRKEIGANGSAIGKDYLDFTISNESGTVAYTWNAEKGEYDISRPAPNALSDGRVAIAVPVQETLETENDYSSDGTKFTYSIIYGDKTYTGKLTEKYITTKIWDKLKDETSKTSYYDNVVANAYRIVEFYDEEDQPMKLNAYTSDAVLEETIRLVVNSGTSTVSYDNKDNFKILVYSGADAQTGGEGGTENGDETGVETDSETSGEQP